MSARSPITTHVLDTALGRPAQGVALILERRNEGTWTELARGLTDSDGRCATLLPPGNIQTGTYRLHFALESYFAASGRESFYPEASVVFRVAAAEEHYHVPLLLAPFAYSTYRGS